MAILGFDLEEIRRLIALLETSGMEELVWEEGERSIRIRGPRPRRPDRDYSSAGARSAASGVRPERAPKPKKIAPPQGVPSADALPPDHIALASPMVGTFYRAEKPGAPPLIDVGQHVEVGQAIGIIEAMKVFSEVEAESSGTVISIPVENGDLVQSGTPLVILQRDS